MWSSAWPSFPRARGNTRLRSGPSTSRALARSSISTWIGWEPGASDLHLKAEGREIARTAQEEHLEQRAQEERIECATRSQPRHSRARKTRGSAGTAISRATSKRTAERRRRNSWPRQATDANPHAAWRRAATIGKSPTAVVRTRWSCTSLCAVSTRSAARRPSSYPP